MKFWLFNYEADAASLFN